MKLNRNVGHVSREIAGHLVDDPSLRFTASGKAVATWQLDTGLPEYGVMHCEAWEDIAESTCELIRNQCITVMGQFKQQEWVSRTTGEKTSRKVFVVKAWTYENRA